MPDLPSVAHNKRVLIGEGTSMSILNLRYTEKIRKIPDARIAITHDDDWCALVDEACRHTNYESSCH